MELRERAEGIVERLMASDDRAYIVSVLEGAFEAAVSAADQAHVKITRTENQVRIDIAQGLRPETALLLMAEAQELVRVRVIAEMVHGQSPLILSPNGGGTRGGDVKFRVGRVGDKP